MVPTLSSFLHSLMEGAPDTLAEVIQSLQELQSVRYANCTHIGPLLYPLLTLFFLSVVANSVILYEFGKLSVL